MRAKVDPELCIGCGMCTGIAPASFQLNQDGKAEFLVESDDEAVQEAMESCPVAAISEDESAAATRE